jgi:rare lipoprotein A (peptidoglycan hydrolase)
MTSRLARSAGWAFGVAMSLAVTPCLAQVSDPSGHGTVTVDAGSYNQAPRVEVGIASWYGGPTVRGKNTASGERFNEKALTAAHPTLPFETRVRVINLTTGKSVIVRINDRNATYTQRVIDLSRKAGEMIGIHYQGTGVVALIPDLPQPAPIPVASQPVAPSPLLQRTAVDPPPADPADRRRPS